jgi:hypothetical protein
VFSKGKRITLTEETRRADEPSVKGLKFPELRSYDAKVKRWLMPTKKLFITAEIDRLTSLGNNEKYLYDINIEEYGMFSGATSKLEMFRIALGEEDSLDDAVAEGVNKRYRFKRMLRK